MDKIDLSDRLLQKIFIHAEQCFPRECCGLIVMIKYKSYYRPCRNLGWHGFELSPVDYAAIEDEVQGQDRVDGKIIAIVHSHCNETDSPSSVDRRNCNISQLPWVIVSWPSKEVFQFTPGGM